MNKKLNDKELENVNGGAADFDPPRASGSVPIDRMPKPYPKDKYVMIADPTDKIIVGTCGPTSTEK